MKNYDESMRDADRAIFSDEELKEMGIYENVVGVNFDSDNKTVLPTIEEKFNMQDTVDLMLSTDYKDRLRAEYLQLGYRLLKSMKYAITGNFNGSEYDISIYAQIRAMLEYFENLEDRMILNGIDIEQLKIMLKEI